MGRAGKFKKRARRGLQTISGCRQVKGRKKCQEEEIKRGKKKRKRGNHVRRRNESIKKKSRKKQRQIRRYCARKLLKD